MLQENLVETFQSVIMLRTMLLPALYRCVTTTCSSVVTAFSAQLSSERSALLAGTGLKTDPFRKTDHIDCSMNASPEGEWRRERSAEEATARRL